MWDLKRSLLFALLVCLTEGAYGQQLPNCEYQSEGKKIVCEEITDPSFVHNIAESTELM